MYAWLRSMHAEIAERTIQSLPRELSLDSADNLRLRPLRELESLRYDHAALHDVTVAPTDTDEAMLASEMLTMLDGDSYEIQITVARDQAQRKRLGIQLFADQDREGLPILLLPEYGVIRVGRAEAPFRADELDADEDLVLRVYVDKYLVEVFVNDRQAVVACCMDYQAANGIRAYSFYEATTFSRVDIWRLRATNQSFFAARDSRVWQVETGE